MDILKRMGRMRVYVLRFNYLFLENKMVRVSQELATWFDSGQKVYNDFRWKSFHLQNGELNVDMGERKEKGSEHTAYKATCNTI